MIKALQHAWKEGREAAALASEVRARRVLKRDFVLSRLLKLGRLPGYNAVRRVSLDGLRVSYRFNRGDLQSLREVLVEQVYACELPFTPQTVLDLGANIGLFSLWMSKQFGLSQSSSKRVPWLLAVEPVAANAAVAEANLRDNGISGEVVRAAVGQQQGEAWFEARAESNLGCLAKVSGTGLRVPVIGIRDLLERFPGGEVDLVKMDIEGAEAELLGRDTDWLSKVKALLVEWHDDRTDSRPLIANVEAAGFAHHRINEARQDNLSLFHRPAS